MEFKKSIDEEQEYQEEHSCNYESYVINRDTGKLSFRLLSEKSPKIKKQPDNLSNITLLDHQRTAIKAMLNAEDPNVKKNIILIENGKAISGDAKISACVNGDNCGSGKTVEFLTLILLSKIPKNRTIYHSISFKDSTNKLNYIVEKRYNYENIVIPTFIFVAPRVLNQWVDSIKKYTDLRLCIVNNIKGLKIFIKLLYNGNINDMYDIILFKNGSSYGTLNIPGYKERINSYDRKYFFNIVSNILKNLNKCVSRVIIDDFDLIKLPINSSSMDSLFIWFVSATKSKTSKKNLFTHDCKDLISSVKYNGFHLSDIIKNDNLFTLQVKTSKDYIEKSSSIGKPIYYLHRVKNANSKYIDLIGVLANSNASEIMEKLNDGAIETAAKDIGIEASTVSEIFNTMLRNSRTNYFKSKKILEWIATIDLDGIKKLKKPTPLNAENEKSLNCYPNVYEKCDAIGMKKIYFNYSNIEKILDNVKNECTELYNESKVSIERLKDNILDCTCPICGIELRSSSLDLDKEQNEQDDEEQGEPDEEEQGEPDEEEQNEECIIMTCCGKILCSTCAIASSGFKKYNNNSIKGKCASCTQEIGIGSLIYLNNDFDMKNILEETEKNGDYLLDDEKIQSLEFTDKLEKTRYDVIKKIIKGLPISSSKEIDIKLNGVMEGIVDLPKAPENEKKILIFTRYTETAYDIYNKLIKDNIVFDRLIGNCIRVNEVMDRYNNGHVNVLLICGEKYCAGLDLQSTTNLILTNPISDKNIMTQVIGRVQRLGRKYKAEIHLIAGENQDTQL